MNYLLALLLIFPALAETIDCPPEVRTDQKILDVPKGWTAEEERVNARQLLRSVDIYEGPVDEGAILAPSETGDTKNSWNLEKGKAHYLACTYGATYMKLVKDLKKADRCEIEYKDKNGTPKAINCR